MLLPISDEKPVGRSTPYINYTLIAINIFVFILEQLYGEEFVATYSTIPYEITHGAFTHAHTVHGLGVIPPGPQPIYITLLTSMFMHAGFLHIGGNMLYLWIFGDNVEDDFGHLKYLIFYLLCGLAASIAQVAVAPDSKIPSLGASGAIAGVLAGYVIMFPTNKVRTLVFFGFVFLLRLPALVVIGFWIILQLFNQFMAVTSMTSAAGGVAYMAHIGGFFTGLILTFLFRSGNGRRRGPSHDREYYYDD